jgi:hypothetical protein
MTVYEVINFLNRAKPTESEILLTLQDKFEIDLVDHIQEMFDFKLSNHYTEYRSDLLNAVFNTNIIDKGLAEFHFTQTEDNFAYTDDDVLLFLEHGSILLQHNNIAADGYQSKQIISDSEEDFLICLLHNFKTNIDFAFRPEGFDLKANIEALRKKVPNRNSNYFTQRIMVAYQR